MPGLEIPLQRLRDAGYKITNARLTVLTVLQASGGHLTSAEILEQVDARDPSIGRASVFRTLELLADLAIIRPTYTGSRAPTYVLLSEEGHHAHIICPACNSVIELEDCCLQDLIAELEARYGISMTGHLLEFYGKCRACSQSGGTSPAE